MNGKPEQSVYVVFGLTGHTGSVVADRLLAAGASVRTLARNAEKVAPWAARGVEVVQGSLTDAAKVRETLEGAAGAYLLLPPVWGAPDLFAAHQPMVEAMVAGVKAADVPRVVVLSSVAAHQPSGTGPIRTLRALEAALVERPGVTFLRPAYFQENLAGSLPMAKDEGVLGAFFNPQHAIEMVATQDIGTTAAELLRQPAASSVRIVNLVGPKPLSMEDVAKVMGEVLGRSVAVQTFPHDAITPMLEAQGAGHYATLYAEMNRGLDEGVVAYPEGEALTRGSTPLFDTLQRLANG
ncbi:MAG: NmrA family NAD(P)-binding protein [Myxococcota bacterium]